MKKRISIPPIKETPHRADGVIDSLMSQKSKKGESKPLQKKTLQNTEIQTYRDTGIQKYRDTDMQVKGFELLGLERTELKLKPEWIESLNKLAKLIMAKRGRKSKQRITKNSIIRACLKVLLPFLCSDPGSLANINTEEELSKRIESIEFQKIESMLRPQIEKEIRAKAEKGKE